MFNNSLMDHEVVTQCGRTTVGVEYILTCIYAKVYIMCTNTLVIQITLLTFADVNRSNIVELLKKGPKSVREIAI